MIDSTCGCEAESKIGELEDEIDDLNEKLEEANARIRMLETEKSELEATVNCARSNIQDALRGLDRY